MIIKIDTSLNSFHLPCIVPYDKDYYIELEGYLKKYFNHIQRIDNLPKECVDKTHDNIDLILKSLKLYNNAKVCETKECIKKLLSDYCNKPYIIAPIDKNYAFRGMAPVEIQPKEYINNNKYARLYNKMNEHPLYFFKARVAVDSINRKDMLHIPFDKRGVIATQRFSIAGVPCLYLATTSFGCWLEMGMPELDLFQVSAFKIPDSMRVLNLCISQHTINGSTGGGYVDEQELQNVCSLIEIFPLVIATSFRVQELNRSFKSEYIISQLLMQVVNDLEIAGIAYLSKKMEDGYAYPQTVNMAILMPCDKLPPYQKESLKMYWKDATKIRLCDAFRYSKFLDDKVKFKRPFLSFINKFYYNHRIFNNVLLGGTVIKYTKSKFSEFDEFLLRQPFHKFK